MNINEVLTHAREMRFADKSDDDLHQMLIVCGNHAGQIADRYSTIQIEHAVKMVQEELARRQREKNHREAIAEQQGSNQKVTEQGKSLHTETMGELEKLKTSVDFMSRSSNVDCCIFFSVFIDGICCVVYFLLFFLFMICCYF
ncbi:MAG: hypothetical protein ABR955_12630, partial [Verrucomicrobiota bacterium]